MRITYRWINEYLNIDISPQEMIDKLILIGHEVEEIIDLGLLDNPIRIARIVRIEPHPNADNLTICRVDDGSGEELCVVCGAPNVEAGAIGVLARVGAKLPDGKVLRRANIRGVRSDGMLLALDEMGLGSDHSGIVKLEADAPVGEGYDMILDIEITPNRPDCLSVLGLARDLTAACGSKILYKPIRLKELYETARQMIDISVKCHKDCPRYTARVIKGIQIAPSPPEIHRRLLALGLRPINNVVDATNLVLMELGHPLHAFDYDKISKQRIVVRLAEAGEKMTIIDGSEVTLEGGKDMVIADASGPVALAGVMGGRDSEVSSETQNILLESAYFCPSTIRLTSRRHNISTDASYRFERGTDPLGLTVALDRATALIVEWSGGSIARGVVEACLRPLTPRTLMLRANRACSVLGVQISKTDMADILARLGFELVRSEGDILVVSVPTYRVDVSREEDLYEEIARIYGYDRIESTMPYLRSDPTAIDASVSLRRFIQDRLTAQSFLETIHLSFVSKEELDGLGMAREETLKLRNPMSREQAVLRPDLTPSMLRTLVYNQNRGNTGLRLFEISRTFHFGDMAAPCVEKEALLLAMLGAAREPSWRGEAAAPQDFYDMKGAIELLLESLGIVDCKLAKDAPQFLHPGRSARLIAGKTEIGWFGELHPIQRERYGLVGRALLGQLQLEAVRPLVKPQRKFTDIPRYPAIERDVALVVDRDMPAERVEAAMRSAAGDLLESLFLFDCYEGEHVAEGTKSLGYRAVYRHAERTLKDEEVEAVQAKILAALKAQTGATLRE